MRSCFLNRLCCVATFLAVASLPRISAAEKTYVELRSPNPNVVLKRMTGEVSASAWSSAGRVSSYGFSAETVCTMPCKSSLDRNAEYFVDGVGIRPSGRFILPSGSAVLDVNTGSSTVWGAGLGLVLGGTGLIGGGLVPLAVGLSSHDSKLLGMGLGFVIPGAVLMLPGAIMVAATQTRVKTESGLQLTQKAGARVRLTQAGPSLIPGGALASLRLAW